MDLTIEKMTSEELIQLEDKHGAHNYHPLEVVLKKGEGVHVWDVEGKKYYLLNLDEEEYAALAISRILQHGPESGAEVEGEDSETDSAPEDEVDVDVDVEA